MHKDKIKILGIVGYSGSGKTTLAERLIPSLQLRGVRCAVIKSTHHSFQVDQPGKDSYRLRHAGAKQILLVSPHRRMIVTETVEHEPQLDEQLSWIDKDLIDIILVEGFKSAPIPKIELVNQTIQKPSLYPNDANVIAVVSNVLPIVDCCLPQFHRDDIAPISQFIINLSTAEASNER